MSGQNTLLAIAEDAQVKRPSHKWNWQVYRDTAVAGNGTYKAMDFNGVIEIIGGPGVFSGIPFGNDTDVAPNNVQVLIPGATLTDGYTFEVNILTTNTGATTMQVNALGVKSVVDSDGNPLAAGMLDNESIYLFVYDLQNDRYQLLGLAKPGPDELWAAGAGLESIVQINTLSPNTATGDYSVASGQSTQATAEASHAEGDGSVASGLSSHAEGDNTQAIGNFSHSEGSASQASGIASHAEGNTTLTIGDNSHAEGNGSVAEGVNSHAEGLNCTSVGDNSHSEGNGSAANGLNSHAEGISTNAQGNNSHAGGESSIATGLNSFVHSNNSQASADDSAILGGVGSVINADSPRSVSLGGNTNSINGQPDTAQAQNLRVTQDFRVTQGANKAAGISAALVAGTLVVANTSVQAGAVILVSHNTQAGVAGILSAPTAGIVAGVSFTIISSSVADIGTVNYLIINP